MFRSQLVCGLLLVSAVLFASEVNAQVVQGYRAVDFGTDVWIPANQVTPTAIAKGPRVPGAIVDVYNCGAGTQWSWYGGTPHLCGPNDGVFEWAAAKGRVVKTPRGLSVQLLGTFGDIYWDGEIVSAVTLPAYGDAGFTYRWFVYSTADAYNADKDRRAKLVKADAEAKVDAAKEPEGKGVKPEAPAAEAAPAAAPAGAAPVKAGDIPNPNNK